VTTYTARRLTTSHEHRKRSEEAGNSRSVEEGQVPHVTLATGAVVEIKIPNLPELVSAGEFPNHLVEVAINVATGDSKVTPEEIKSQAEFYRKFLIAKTG
jgi:hypothetical protein